MSKPIKLLADEFIPHQNTGSFWQLPKSITESEHLSLGAKVLYAVLIGLGCKRGTAWPKKATLRRYLGNPSDKTIYRWQRELVDAQLIRVHQKGRGLSNNFYFLRHPLVENTYTGEFDGNPRYVYTNPETGERTLKTQQECWTEFMPKVTEWLEHQKIERTAFPKPHWRYDQKDYREVKKQYEEIANLTMIPKIELQKQSNYVSMIQEFSDEILQLQKRGQVRQST